jgi:hypothetical protein
MYATKSLSELKAIAAELNIVPTGDKRSKAVWIAAIEAHALLSESMPKLPSHAEQEVIEIAADMVMAVTTSVESITESFTCEAIVTDYSDIPETIAESKDEDIWTAPEMPTHAEQEAMTHAVDVAAPAPSERPTKLGAAVVVGALVCVVILLFRTLIFGIFTIAQFGSYIVRLFGKYDPDLDLTWRLKRDRLEFIPA